MSWKAIALGLALWGIDVLFLTFMMAFSDVERAAHFRPIMIGILIIMLPVNLFAATKMPGVKKSQ